MIRILENKKQKLSDHKTNGLLSVGLKFSVSKVLIISILLMLFVSCSDDGNNNVGNGGETDNFMRLSMKSAEDAGSDSPCFIFWTQSDFNESSFGANPAEPYYYSIPSGMIDDYRAVKYNTGKVYPPYAEPVYAVGISPASLLGLLEPAQWAEFDVPASLAGITDIQCAPVIAGNEQTPFADTLKFAHQLAKLEFKAFCGASMRESASRYIDVKDVTISVSSDVDNQWKWFPEKLTWKHGNIGVGQYVVSGYENEPAEIVATVSSLNPSSVTILNNENNDEESSVPVGNFYFVPGFDKITVRIEATYVDSTTDGNLPAPGNGQENERVWEEMTIDKIHSNAGEPTEIGTAYTIYVQFERSRIVLGVSLKDWGNDIEN